MTPVHYLAAGYLIAFIALLAYLMQHTRRLARLARRLETLEHPATTPEQSCAQPRSTGDVIGVRSP